MKPSISRVLEHYGARAHARGGWQKLKCPFHDDRHASAGFNEDKGYFKCFTCDVAGDAYDIIMKQEGVGFVDAKRRAEEITGASSGSLSAVHQRSGFIPKREGNTTSNGRKFSFRGSEGAVDRT